MRFSIDGLICTNTTISHDHFSGSGGLSGKPLMGPSTETLKVARMFLGSEFPIIASGGVMSKEDYLKKLSDCLKKSISNILGVQLKSSRFL